MRNRSFPSGLALLVIFSICISSCDRSNDPTDDSNNQQTCLLTELKYIGEDGASYNYKFTYDGDRVNTLTTESTNAGSATLSSIDLTFTYDGDGQITELKSQIETNVYAYKDGLLVKRETVNVSGVPSARLECQYEDGKLIQIQYYIPSGNTLFKGNNYKFKYTDASGKEPAVREFYNSNGTLLNTSTFTYKEHNAGTAAMTKAFKKIWDIGQPIDLALSTVVSTTGTTTNYTYVLDANGFPTSRVETNNTGMLIGTTTYSYLCR